MILLCVWRMCNCVFPFLEIDISKDGRESLRQYQTTLQELLRHYWSSIPVMSLATARKVYIYTNTCVYIHTYICVYTHIHNYAYISKERLFLRDKLCEDEYHVSIVYQQNKCNIIHIHGVMYNFVRFLFSGFFSVMKSHTLSLFEQKNRTFVIMN